MHHQNASGERHDGTHHVLDQYDRETRVTVQRLQDSDDAIRLGRTQARHHFIEQQQFRIGGERTRHFEPLAIRQRERRCALGSLVIQVETTQHIVRMRARRNDAMTIQQRSDDVLVVEEGSLYPALYRMEEKGWIAAEWGKSENNRRAKFYKLTAKGRRQLHVETTRWEKLARAIANVLKPAREGSV